MNWRPLHESHWKQLEFHHDLVRKNRPELCHALGNIRECAQQLEIIEEERILIGVRARTPDGIQVLVSQERGAIQLQEQNSAIEKALNRGARLLLFSGIGAGHVLDNGLAHIKQYPAMGMIAWDSNRYAWAAFLSLFNAKEILEQTGRLFLFGEENPVPPVCDFIRRQSLFLFPFDRCAYMLGFLPKEPQSADPYIQQARDVARVIQDENEKFLPQIASFWRGASHVVNGYPRSVWCSVHRQAYIHFPIAQAFLDGFARQGMKTHLAPYEDRFGCNLEILGHLFEKQPELYLAINTWPTALLADLGLPESQLETMRALRIGWMVDDTLLYEDQGSPVGLGENDFMFCCDRSYLSRLESQHGNIYFLPHATIFDQPGTPRDTFRADLSYVGSLPMVDSLMQSLPDACREILQQVENLRSQDFSCTFRNTLQSLEPAREEMRILTQTAHDFCQTTRKGFRNPDTELDYFLYNTATYFKRLRTVLAFLPLGLVVYGPPSWKESLPNEYQDRYRGFIAADDLADCYASSKICLNIHSHQCPTSLNPRDFDVPMAGSVVLGDWVEDVERGFMNPGKEILAYRSIEEGVEMARHFLEDAGTRSEILRQGQERVCREHTYAHRAKRILDSIIQ